MVDFYCDLQSEDKNKSTARVIFEHIFIKRLKQNKPCIVFIGGDSGEGKTWSVIRLLEELQDKPDVENQIIYTPFEYTKKVNWILFNKESKGKNILIFMEARELVKGKTWYSIINQAISDVNALSREIKPLLFIVVSQHPKDIDSSVRTTINYYGRCSRPQDANTRLSLNKTWKNWDLNSPKIYQRKIKGVIVGRDGDKKNVTIRRFIMNAPSADIIAKVQQLDRHAKEKIIKQKLLNIDKALAKEISNKDKIGEIADSITKNPATLTQFIKKDRKGNITIKPIYKTIYDLNDVEFKELSSRINDLLIEQGIIHRPEARAEDDEDLKDYNGDDDV